MSSIPAPLRFTDDSHLPTHGIAGASPEAERLDALTALRFFAATMVAVLHTARYFAPDNQDPFAHIALQQGVSFFFVLSGFILCYKYPHLEDGRARLKFWVYRIARIWPAHFTTGLLFILTVPACFWWTVGNRSPLVILSNVSMLHAFLPPCKFYFGLNAPSWSISCEFFFYLMFPLLLVGWQKNWGLKLAGSAALVMAILSTYAYYAPHQVTNDHLYFLRWVVYINPVVRLFEFVLGMSTALMYTRSIRAFEKWTIAEITWLQATAMFICFIALAICSSLIQVYPPPAMPSPFAEWAVGSGGALAYAFLIFAMAQTRGGCARALANPLLIWLGEISYSIYIVHYLLLDIYLVHFAPYCTSTNQPLWLCYSAYWTALIASCATMYYLVEKPARKLLPSLLLGSTKPSSLQRRQPDAASSEKAKQLITKV